MPFPSNLSWLIMFSLFGENEPTPAVIKTDFVRNDLFLSVVIVKSLVAVSAMFQLVRLGAS